MLGTVIFVVAEVMLFAGFISGYTVLRTQSPGPWPPPGQPRLPVQDTAFNTAMLLASGLLLWLAHRGYHRDPGRARLPLLGAIALGTFFVASQGVEWVALVREGLTLTSSPLGSFFYLIVGTHALHAVAGLLVLVWVGLRLAAGQLTPSALHAGEVFWYFVVGLWPFLYWRVYLS